MFIIRKEQIESLSLAQRKNFILKMKQYFLFNYPIQTQHLENIDNEIEKKISLGNDSGFNTEIFLASFVEYCIIFKLKTENQEVIDILNNKLLSEDMKLVQLSETIIEKSC